MRPHRWLCFLVTFVTAVVAAIPGLVASPAHAAVYDYVRNGSFEAGTEGWTLLSDGSSFDTAPDLVPAVDGASRGRITLGQPNFRLNQSMSDVPPGIYALTLSVRVESPSAVVRLDVLSDPSWAPTYSPVTFSASPGEWQTVSTDIELSGSAWVSIRLTGTGVVGDKVYVDQVSFEGAPPATMTPTYTHTPTVTPVPPTPTKTARTTVTPAASTTSTGTPALQAAQQTETLANGGFEDAADGLPVAWSKYGGSLSTVQGPVRSGARSAKLESNSDSTKWVFQTVTIKGASNYVFEAWIWHADPNVAAAFLRVSWYQSADGSGEAIGTADSAQRLEAPLSAWRMLTTQGITAPPDARAAKVRIMLQPRSDVKAVVYADDASFAPSSGPAATPPLITAADPSASSARTERATLHPAGSASAQIVGSDVPGANRVRINEVHYDSLDEDDAGGEWIELYNPLEAPLTLDGWYLADNNVARQLPDIVLRPRAYTVIVASDRLFKQMNQLGVSVTQVPIIGNSLNNDGDIVALISPSGRIVDAVSWGANTSALNPAVVDVPSGHSIERRISDVDTDRAFDFVDNESPSPGQPFTQSQQYGGAPRADSDRAPVQILQAENPVFPGWLPWVAAALALGALATVAFGRFVPAISQRLRHE